jgi:hypothetical protein
MYPSVLTPNWKNKQKVHDWRNYISQELQEMWDTFTYKQKEAIARNADEQASNEHWD